jgi:hypothetical protein
MKLPFKAAAAFIASPQGRRAIKRAREKYDTPENRERAAAALKDLRSRIGQRKAGAGARPRSRRRAHRPAGLP